jgi:ATP-dependent Clp protease ATP-binding subunit ClpB
MYSWARLQRSRRLQAAKTVASTIRLVQPAIQDLNQATRDIRTAASRWTGIQVEDVQKPDASKLLSLKDQLLKRVVGQDEAVTAVANAVIRSRAGLAVSERWPSFLFLGPPGVYPCPHHLVSLQLDACNLMLH